MAHTYNPSYSEGSNLEDHGLRPVWAKNWKTSSQQISWVWWFMSVIPVTLEVWVEGLCLRLACAKMQDSK
jgi:hypothetical protein